MLGHISSVLLRVSDNKWHWLFFKQRWATIGPTHVPTKTEEDALLHDISHTGIKLYLRKCFFLVQDSWKMRIFLKVLRARCPCKRFGAPTRKVASLIFQDGAVSWISYGILTKVLGKSSKKNWDETVRLTDWVDPPQWTKKGLYVVIAIFSI